jgi:TonB-linked SusC/RagA family outer membrane protein
MKLTFLYKPLRAIGPVKCKLVLVMKLTTILLLVGILHLSAATYSQNVTISRRNASLETIFKDIKQQTGYLFFYNWKVNLKANNVTVELRNATLADALNTCLAKYDLTYAIVDKTIVISAKPPATHAEVSPVYNKIHVSGTVIDSATRASLPGVNIMLKTAKPMHTQTNDKGEFSIDADPGDLLVFTFIGYKPKTVKVTDSKPMQVGLALQVTNVNDVVVTGYQMIKKDNYTGSAIIIKGEDLRRFNPQSIIESLASFDPSLRIGDNTISGSNPNVLSNITIRGSTTLPSLNGQILDKNNLSSDYNLPIFMLDGFSVSLQKVTDLDINRIASITILKDAAATAVYGSRAANGVIVITTKAPKPGKLQLTYNSELRVNAPDLSDYHVLNASQKLQYEKLAGLYTSGDVAATQSQLDEQYYAKLKNVVSGVNTYWLSQPVRNAFGQKHSLYAEGGDTSFRYGVDMRYETSPGVMKGSGVKRYSGGMNFNYNPNRNLLVRNEVTITQVNGENSKYGDFAQYVYMEPYYPIKDESGNLIREIANWKVDTHQSGPDQIKTVPVYNPLYEASLGNFDKNAYLEFVDDFSADYKITPSLRVIGLISLNNTKSSVDQFTSPFSNEFFNGPASEIKDRGRYIYKTKNALTYDGNVRLIYNKQVSDHSINAALVFKARSVKEDEKAFEARGFSNDRFTNIGFARTYALNAAPINKIALNREMGSILTSNYAFKNKYLLDASFTMDGSSAFGSNNKVAPFWSVGVRVERAQRGVYAYLSSGCFQDEANGHYRLNRLG